MNPNIRPSLHIALSYCLLLFLAFGFFNMIIMPQLQSTHDKTNSVRQLLEQNERFTLAIESYHTQLDQDSTDPAVDPESTSHFIEADTAALAGAQLQNRLRSLVENSKAELINSAFRREETEGSFEKISVNIRLRSSTAALKTFLYDIESQQWSLFVENLVIQSRHRPGREIRQANDQLEVRMNVIAYINTSS